MVGGLAGCGTLRPVDAHVLLSTIATAAAALVAIVGGLLVSRVISLASEQNGLAKRCDDLEADAAVAQARLAELDGRLLPLEIQECLDEVREDHVRGRKVDVAKVIAECAPTRALDEIGPALRRQAERFAAIRAALTPAFAHGWTSWRWCASSVIVVASGRSGPARAGCP